MPGVHHCRQSPRGFCRSPPTKSLICTVDPWCPLTLLDHVLELANSTLSLCAHPLVYLARAVNHGVILTSRMSIWGRIYIDGKTTGAVVCRYWTSTMCNTSQYHRGCPGAGQSKASLDAFTSIQSHENHIAVRTRPYRLGRRPRAKLCTQQSRNGHVATDLLLYVRCRLAAAAQWVSALQDPFKRPPPHVKRQTIIFRVHTHVQKRPAGTTIALHGSQRSTIAARLRRRVDHRHGFGCAAPRSGRLDWKFLLNTR